jgi:hypothetical protein
MPPWFWDGFSLKSSIARKERLQLAYVGSGGLQASFPRRYFPAVCGLIMGALRRISVQAREHKVCKRRARKRQAR